jgi:uridine phosphorylase
MIETPAIINPYRSSKTPRLDSLAMMVSTRNDLSALVKRLDTPWEDFSRIFTSRLFQPKIDGNSLSVAGPMMGAPYAVAILETLIVWGVRKVLYWGWCGGMSPKVGHGDVIIPTAVLSAEGTSRHYHPRIRLDDPVEPSPKLVEALGEALSARDLTHHTGTVWTTDAIYRETRDRIAGLQAQGVLAVEMELSALVTVARFRGVELAAGLVVSDDLSTLTWNPGFKSKAFQQGREAGLDGLIACCRTLLCDSGSYETP